MKKDQHRLRLNRRKFLALSTGALASTMATGEPVAVGPAAPTPCMLAPIPGSGFTTQTLATTGESIGNYRPPGIMDGMGAWNWNDAAVRLFVNHELDCHEGYPWELANGTSLRGARISWFDIDKQTRTIMNAGNAIKEIRDRRGDIVTHAEQVSEAWDRNLLDWWYDKDQDGLNNLCSAQACKAGEFGFVDDLLFTHEEVSALSNHPHGGSVWALEVHTDTLWALPELGRGA